MKPVTLSLVALAVALLGAACESVDSTYGYSRPYVPRVAMPYDLDETERRLVPEVASVLDDAGYRPTSGGDADYELAFSVDSGPLRTDVRMALLRGREEVANSFARVGSARSLFRRAAVVREAFDRCLREFETRLPRVGSPSERYRRDAYRSDDDGPDDRYGDQYNDSRREYDYRDRRDPYRDED